MAIIDKKALEHLADLARIELDQKEEKRLLGDLEKILEHFEELKEIDTENVPGMTGGTELKSIVREDEIKEKRLRSEDAKDAFPEVEGDYLKVPAVFE